MDWIGRAFKRSDPREIGNEAFKNKDLDQAVASYSEGLEQLVGTDQKEQRATLLSNRSAAYASMEKWSEALADADEAIALNSNWSKAWARKGKAHWGLREFKKAASAYARGLELELRHSNEAENRHKAELEVIQKQAQHQAEEYQRLLQENAALQVQLDDYLCMFNKEKRG
mmetsp:Transcript_16756/g.25180  ORF Transcript_16756/g.25180 Transcript_16756/m.25180 type:complete len:171 (-) Transcript_16756:114-626(-)